MKDVFKRWLKPDRSESYPEDVRQILDLAADGAERLVERYRNMVGMASLDVGVQGGEDEAGHEMRGLYACMVSKAGYVEAWQTLIGHMGDREQWEVISTPAEALMSIENVVREWVALEGS